jgi:excisionase family DNA binding protein
VSLAVQNRNNLRSESIPNPAYNLPPRGLRIREAAAYIGVTPWFLEIAIRERRIPALRLGRAYTLLKEDLDSFLDSERNKLLGRSAVVELEVER